MEKLSFFFLLFIFVFLVYSYFKAKKTYSIEETIEKKETTPKSKTETPEKFIIAAALAAIMDGKKYKIRNIFCEKEDKKVSPWKLSGRTYNMQRRDRI